MNISDELVDKAIDLQQESHKFIEMMNKRTTVGAISHQDWTNVYLFFKLAEMQEKIDKILSANKVVGKTG